MRHGHEKSQQCKQQVETAEAREHQEVSLNPIIRE
jgi:hypothetical protein